MEEKILLLGGFGFIGKNIVEMWDAYYDLVIIDKNIDDEFTKRNPHLRYYQYDFSNQEEFEKIISHEKPQYIINLISIVTSERDLNLFPSMIKSNINILLNVYELVKNLESLKLLIQIGSGEEYGNISSPFKETDKEYPSSPYAIVKLATTNTALMLNRNYNFPICVVRPANIFGKYQEKNKFVPYVIESLKKNKSINMTLGNQKRDLIYVKDFLFLLKSLMINSDKVLGKVINIGSSGSVTLKEIVLYLKKIMKSSSTLNFGAIPHRENEIMDFLLDDSRLYQIIEKKSKLNILEKISEYIGDNNEIFY